MLRAGRLVDLGGALDAAPHVAHVVVGELVPDDRLPRRGRPGPRPRRGRAGGRRSGRSWAAPPSSGRARDRRATVRTRTSRRDGSRRSRTSPRSLAVEDRCCRSRSPASCPPRAAPPRRRRPRPPLTGCRRRCLPMFRFSSPERRSSAGVWIAPAGGDHGRAPAPSPGDRRRCAPRPRARPRPRRSPSPTRVLTRMRAPAVVRVCEPCLDGGLLGAEPAAVSRSAAVRRPARSRARCAA